MFSANLKKLSWFFSSLVLQGSAAVAHNQQLTIWEKVFWPNYAASPTKRGTLQRAAAIHPPGSAFRATPWGSAIVPHGPKGRHQFGCDSPRIAGMIVPGEVL